MLNKLLQSSATTQQHRIASQSITKCNITTALPGARRRGCSTTIPTEKSVRQHSFFQQQQQQQQHPYHHNPHTTRPYSTKLITSRPSTLRPQQAVPFQQQQQQQRIKSSSLCFTESHNTSPYSGIAAATAAPLLLSTDHTTVITTQPTTKAKNNEQPQQQQDDDEEDEDEDDEDYTEQTDLEEEQHLIDTPQNTEEDVVLTDILNDLTTHHQKYKDLDLTLSDEELLLLQQIEQERAQQQAQQQQEEEEEEKERQQHQQAQHQEDEQPEQQQQEQQPDEHTEVSSSTTSLTTSTTTLTTTSPPPSPSLPAPSERDDEYRIFTTQFWMDLYTAIFPHETKDVLRRLGQLLVVNAKLWGRLAQAYAVGAIGSLSGKYGLWSFTKNYFINANYYITLPATILTAVYGGVLVMMYTMEVFKEYPLLGDAIRLGLKIRNFLMSPVLFTIKLVLKELRKFRKNPNAYVANLFNGLNKTQQKIVQQVEKHL